MQRRVLAAPDLIRVRPRAFTTFVSRGRSVFATTLDGTIPGDDHHGLFVHETRLLSHWRYRIDGQAPEPTALSIVRQHHWVGYYVLPAPGVTRPPKDSGSGSVPWSSQITLELRVTRVVGDGVHEDLDLTNYTTESSSFLFEIEVDADFADQGELDERRQFGTRDVQWTAVIPSVESRDLGGRGARHELRAPPKPQVPRLTLGMTASAARLTFDYRAEHEGATLHRGIELEIANATSAVTYADGRLQCAVTLAPHERWHACIRMTSLVDGTRLQPPIECYGTGIQTTFDEGTQFESPGSDTMTADVLSTLAQARTDLAALRLFDLDRGPRAWTVAAGLPLYISLFGRDTLTAGWQAALVGPEIMSGTLPLLAELQGTREDDWRDEQPGKMLHEAHTGPLSTLGFNPRKRGYSSVTTSGLYPFIAAELWHWTGDKDLVRPLIEPALRAFQWLEKYGDLDGDGFYEYKTRSPMGPVHHAWKDSPDAIVYEDGQLVQPPIATSEEQAFVYISKLHFAELLWSFGERDLSRRFYAEATELKKRFNETFWIEDDGFYAMALDARKRPVRSIGSNAGHCIATAIADASLVERTADRLFAPDLFTGWGIRTLSSHHPRYNPYSYHLGSIWPVEHGTFAMGFMRYGLHDRVQQLARAQFDAASVFEFHRLPELFAGHPRDAQHPFPAIYPGVNSPQAWSSSSVFSLLQAMLGIYPYAPLKLLILDPHLPEWLPEITLSGLRIGKARATIRFRRRADGRTSYRILEQEGKLHVIRQATPWSLTAQPAERLRDALASLLPGR